VNAELDKVVGALQAFYARESWLLAQDVGERALTYRLAVQIEAQFPGWDIDCDYNRLGERRMLMPKGTIVSTDDSLAKSVYPDIVVHRRSIPKNLLALDVRKATNHQPLDHDRHKLRALTDPHLWFAFWIGTLLRLATTNVAGAEVYVGGELDRALTDWFAERLKQAGLIAA
jgi:hypothetical protein